MLNVCLQCGEYRDDKEIDRENSIAICPVCRHPHPILLLPGLFVCGASGSGKSTLCNQLIGSINEVVVLDGDILWRDEFNQPENNHRNFFETWLRLSKNIAQSGRPVVLFNAGANPNNVEPCVERRYFSGTHYLALVLDEQTLKARLAKRPLWRNCSHAAFVRKQVEYNQWLKAQAPLATSPLELVDTTHDTPEQTTARVAQWIRAKIAKG